MKRMLLALVVAIPVLGSAQVSTIRYDLPESDRLTYHKNELVDLFVEGGIRFRPLSKLELAVAARQLVHAAEDQLKRGQVPGWNENNSRKQWPVRFWIYRWLRDELGPELAEIGVDLADYDARVEAIKFRLAMRGIIVEDPYARFLDVPKGHWADEAIHSLRRAGIIRGYSDNTFRL